MANSVIVGNKTISGTTMGSWTSGLSAYDLAVRYQGYNKDIISWLESLKAVSPTLSEPVIDTENGTLTYVITDENGEHTVTLRNGLDIKVESTEVTEDGTLVTFNDGTSVLVGNGQQGEQGIPGREVVFRNIGDTLYWRYATDDMEWKQLADLIHVMESVYNAHPPFIYVDELPDPANAIEGVEYRLRQGGD